MMLLNSWFHKLIDSEFSFHISPSINYCQHTCVYKLGGRSCAKVQRVFAKKFGFGQILSPNKRFCCDIKNCRNFRTFWKTLGKALFFGPNTVFIGQEEHYHMVHMAYGILMNKICKFAIMPRNDGFVAQIANTRLTKVLWPFLPSPKSCQLLPPCVKEFLML